MKKIRENFFIIFICVLISFISIMAYDRFFAIKIKSVDLTSYLQELKEEYKGGKLTEKQLESKFEDLEETLKRQPKNNVIINSEVVIKNAEKLQL